MSPNEAYSQLVTSLKEISTLSSASAVLSWDQETYMPPNAGEHRANQLSLLAKLTHQQFTSPKIGELIAAAETADEMKQPDSDFAVTVRETRRDYDRSTKLPTRLVEELARTASLAQTAWATARRKNDFPAFEPWLSKMYDLKREEAQCLGFKDHIYDALLDQFEPGETTENVRAVFASLRDELVSLVHKIAGSSRKAPVSILERKYPKALQEKFAVDAAAALGYDFASGRLDVTAHPFCTSFGPGDTRITTRYDENFFGDAFFSVLHEAGHAMYEQGLPKKELFGSPLADAISLGIHESQSRMWENLVGRSRSFWKFYFPKAKAAFGDIIADVNEDQWLFAVNAVQPSLIRTESDETTYNLHVLLRFEIEQALLTRELSTKDLPAAWNDKMKQYLGIVPPTNADGCMQDVHWSCGLVGYFPTYTLGNLYAAQFFEQARADLGDLDDMFSRGEFAPLLNWLRTNIHRHGKRYTARDLVKRVTGKELSAKPLLNHLARKASEWYGV